MKSVTLQANQLFLFAVNTAGDRACGLVAGEGDLKAAWPSFSQRVERELGASPRWKVVATVSEQGPAAKLLRALGPSWEKWLERAAPTRLIVNEAEGRLQIEKSTPTISTAPATGRIRVLIVDDSATMRAVLRKIISEDPRLEVVAEAARPSEAEPLIKQHQPQVITLDVHMPEESGVSLLRRIQPRYGIPTVMVTAIGLQEGRDILDALEIGAVDYVQKPSQSEMGQVGGMLREKIVMASQTRSRASAGRRQSTPAKAGGSMDQNGLIALGASTGGTEALRCVLTALPESIPPILIVQHIPPVFSRAFAERMNELCPFEVRESEDGMEVRAGRAIIAAGGAQMDVVQSGGKMKVRFLPSADPVNRHKPSVDYLFDSLRQLKVGGPRVAAILTGMGGDGARGMLALRQLGWHTLAQDEESCIVFGMPKEAIKLGGAIEVVPLGEMAARIALAAAPMKKRTA